MFCYKCGTEIVGGMEFCHKCGTKVAPEGTQPKTADLPQSADRGETEGAPAIKQTEEAPREKLTEGAATEQDPSTKHGASKFHSWWERSSKFKKVLFVLASVVVGLFVLNFLVSFLREFGYLLFGILIIGAFLIAFFTGSKEERIEARKTLIKLVVMIGAVVLIVGILVFKPDTVADIVQPGAGVRNAYLTQYSNKVTIEEAFDNFFANEKWGTYEADGYSYVTFTGTCEYLGEPADARITFKITGENFLVDRLDINGIEQNNLILAAMLEKIYEEY